jgi:hypothetical protein
MQKLTKQQALAITGYTGITALSFSDFHGDVEQRLGHPVWTHQFADPEFMDKVKSLYKQEFLEMLYAE